ncbi:MAG: exopolyphosphatase [Stomatobaculum sp.]|nr:exopolyphosphatase [Stomatobaculum sp.]
MAGRRFAAIGVGSFELELGIYEIDAKYGIRNVDMLRHVIAIGSETYDTGRISYQTAQEITEVLSDFVNVMKSYRCAGCTAYATSALREARNRNIVLEQIRVHTGLEVKIISNSEQRFLSYKALAAAGGGEFNELIKEGTAIVDLSFGSMQISLFDEGKMISTQNLRVGALRLRDQMNELTTARDGRERLLTELVDHELEIYSRLHLQGRKIRNLIAMGEPVRVLFDRLMRKEGKDPQKQRVISRRTLEKGYTYIIDKYDSELEDLFGVSIENASVFVPTAAVYSRVAGQFGPEQIWVPGTILIDGIAAEYAFSRKLVKPKHDFDADIISAAEQIAARYGSFDAHRIYAVENTLKIFDAIRKPQGFSERDRLLIHVAAVLHHCGRFVNMGRAGLSSYEIIHATEIIGLSDDEHEIVSLVLRHENIMNMPDDVSMRAAKMIAIISLADALDRSAKQKGGDFKVTLGEDGRMTVSTKFSGDLSLEQLTFEKNSRFFNEIFGIEPVLRQKRAF